MSSSRLRFDDCNYRHSLNASVGVGNYILETPFNDCVPCYPEDPATRIAHRGGASCPAADLIDVDSEMMGITRPYTRCPTQVPPSIDGICASALKPRCASVPTEETRLSNPPCNLRGLTANRWEWLPRDPQAHALRPFEAVDSQLLAKDTHRPLVPVPVDASLALPPRGAQARDPMWASPCHAAPTEVVHWRKCCDLPGQ